MDDKKLKIVYVGKNHEYTDLEQALFDHKENARFIIEKGTYECNIELNDYHNIEIEGNNKVFLKGESGKKLPVLALNYSSNLTISGIAFQASFYKTEYSDSLTIDNCSNINIVFCSFKNSNYGCNIYISKNIIINGCFFLYNVIGYQIRNSFGTVCNNTIIKCKNDGISISFSSITIKENIICENNRGIVLTQYSTTKNVTVTIKIYRNCLFNNSLSNFEGIPKILQTQVYTKKLQFKNPAKYDYRVKDKIFQHLGAPEQVIMHIVDPDQESQKQQENQLKNAQLISTITPLFFLNMKIQILINEIKTILQEKKEEWQVEKIIFINSLEELEKETKNSVNYGVFLINAFDLHQDKDLIFTIISYCKSMGIQFHILQMSEKFELSPGKIALEEYNIVQKIRKSLQKIAKEKILFFSSYQEFTSSITNQLIIGTVPLRLQSLKLSHIGHFGEELVINFDEKLTCFIGINGTGKTTILRALSLAIAGFKHKKIKNQQVGYSLSGIKGLDKNQILREKGKITIVCSIEEGQYTSIFEHTIELISDEEGNIEFKSSEPSPFLQGTHFKSLILGFAQLRGGLSINDKDNAVYTNRILPPNINDLLSLINNEGDYRLETFSSWIADLDAKANQKEKEALARNSPVKIQEREIINKVFHIISAITDQQTCFLEVRQQSTNDVWITTEDAPNGIPLRLISQGFQAVIGWIGYFLQRLAESYPTADDFTKEPAILIIDEIDTYIHPRWQKKIIPILQNEFPGTQFIIATHSPLVLNGLNRHQIIHLKKEEKGYQIIAESNPIDIWAWSYHDILHNFYNTTINQNKYSLEELEERIKVLEKKKKRTTIEEEEFTSLKDNFQRLKASIEYENELEQLKQILKERDEELKQVIKKVKKEK